MFPSDLFDESTFYQKFLEDLKNCQEEVIIETPYLTLQRIKTFDRLFEKLLEKGVKIYIITRDPIEHEETMVIQAEQIISWFERIGVQVLICEGNHHRKLAILDRKILWEGSLNILSQTYSREIMRRIESVEVTKQMVEFLALSNFLN